MLHTTASWQQTQTRSLWVCSAQVAWCGWKPSLRAKHQAPSTGDPSPAAESSAVLLLTLLGSLLTDAGLCLCFKHRNAVSGSRTVQLAQSCNSSKAHSNAGAFVTPLHITPLKCPNMPALRLRPCETMVPSVPVPACAGYVPWEAVDIRHQLGLLCACCCPTDTSAEGYSQTPQGALIGPNHQHILRLTRPYAVEALGTRRRDTGFRWETGLVGQGRGVFAGVRATSVAGQGVHGCNVPAAFLPQPGGG